MYRALQSLFLQRGQNVPHAFGYFITARHMCVESSDAFFLQEGKGMVGLGRKGSTHHSMGIKWCLVCNEY